MGNKTVKMPRINLTAATSIFIDKSKAEPILRKLLDDDNLSIDKIEIATEHEAFIEKLLCFKIEATTDGKKANIDILFDNGVICRWQPGLQRYVTEKSIFHAPKTPHYIVVIMASDFFQQNKPTYSRGVCRRKPNDKDNFVRLKNSIITVYADATAHSELEGAVEVGDIPVEPA